MPRYFIKGVNAMKNLLLLTLVLVIGWSTASFAQQEMSQRTVTLSIPTMTCPVCPITVKKSLEKVSGVSKVKVDFETKTAIVTFNSQKVEIKALTKATMDAGFPSQVNK